MPEVLADYGPTMLVRFPDGSQQEVIRDSYERMFPGGSYQQPTQPQRAADVPPALPPELQPSQAALGASPPAGAAPTGPVAAAPAVPSGAGEASALSLPQAPPVPSGLAPQPNTGGAASPGGPTGGDLPTIVPPASGRQSLRQYGQRTAELGGARIEAAQSLGAAQEDEATKIAAALDEHNRRTTELEGRRQKAHEAGLAEADRRGAEIDKLADEHGKMRIDRGRLFANMSTFDKILAGIGFGLSAVSTAKAGGGPNPALQIIGNAVENDVRDQQAMIEQAGKNVEMRRTLYKDFLERLGNKQAAYDMTIATTLAQAKRQVEIIGAQSKSAQIKAQTLDLTAQLGQQIADKLEQVRATASAEGYRNAQLKASKESAEVDARYKLAQMRKMEAEATQSELDVSPGERARKLGVAELKGKAGKPVLFRSSESAEKVAESQGATTQAAQLIDRLILARQEHGWSSDLVKSDEWRQMQADFAKLKLTLKDTDKLGVLAGPDMGLIEGALGTSDPTEARDPTAGLKTARDNLVNQFNARAKAQVADGDMTRWEPPKLRELAAFEAPRGENIKAFLADAPPGLEDDPEAKEAMAREKKAILPAIARNASPQELNSILAHVSLLEQQGVLSIAEADEMRSKLTRKKSQAERDRPLTPAEMQQRVNTLDINLR